MRSVLPRFTQYFQDLPQLTPQQFELALGTMEDVLAAVDEINTDYAAHCWAAREVSREYFATDTVLPKLLREAGL